MLKFCLIFLLFVFALPNCSATLRPISQERFHLGTPGQPEWDIFAADPPVADKLRLEFQAKQNEREFTLFIRQDDVKEEWTVLLNGRKLGSLFQMEAGLVHTLPIPAGVLRDGTNALEFSAKTHDDIVISEISIGDDTKPQLLNSGLITISVDDPTGSAIPSRLTIVDRHGSLAAIYDFGSTNLATRPGVIYTATGHSDFTLLPGDYTIYATRGPEYSVAKAHLTASNDKQTVHLTINRVVDTSGWAAADTHIHTFSLSRHGDALLRERVITLAGETVELVVSTEHNLHADYLAAAKELGLDKYFTFVPGNEVTTARGHFNIFPVELSAPPPNYKVLDWPELTKLMRATPRVQVVILNHPKDAHNDFTPFAVTNLNLVTGRNLRGDFSFSFDAMELINSGAMRSDWMEPFRAWFALLNRGYKITGVGASDSHDVSRFIVGQGRTYIQVNDSDPARIDIDKACASLKAAHAVVSLGIFPQIRIGGAGPGDLLSANGSSFELTVTADWPKQFAPNDSNAKAEIAIYANGHEAFHFQHNVSRRKNGPISFTRKIPKPAQDTYYVAIVKVPAACAPFWGLARPYQPTSKHWDPLLLGATNPVWVDVDGDGRFESPHARAEKLVQKYGNSADALLHSLAHYDWATAAQTAELLDLKGVDLRSKNFQDVLTNTAPQTRAAFNDYLASLPPG